MIDKRKVPEIRFKGFDGEWEGNEFSGLVSRITSMCDHLELPRIEYEDIVSGSGILNKDVFKKKSIKRGVEFDEGDILFGKLRPYLNNLLWPHFKGIAVGDFWVLRANKTDAAFVYSLIQNSKFQYVANLSAGSKMPRSDWSIVSLSKFLIPASIKEQSQVGTFLQNLDSLITLHQRKFDKLTTVKKAMLEKMFPKDGADVPEIRFKGFTEKWERLTLGEIVTEIRRPIELMDEHEYELVTVKRRNEGVVSRGKLKGKDILVKTYFELRSGDYIISKRQIVHGANGIVPQSLDKAIVSNEYLVAVGNERITTDFFALFSKLPHMYKKFFLSSYGIDIEKLVFDVDDWKKRFVAVPCLPEQQRISSFFQNLDSLITLQQRELDKLKNIKKACLVKMFV